MNTDKRIYPKVPANIPVIEHWITLPDAADELGLSRQRVYLLAAEGKFKSLRRLSPKGKPQFVVKRSDLAVVVEAREAAKAEHEVKSA